MVAYCSQSPWLQSGTIRKAICGVVKDKLVDEEWYNTVLGATALKYDISNLPKGDLTMIGNRGITLSGGQKHRVALARALYSRCDIFVLDDILSALDKKTESIIAEKLFGAKGLFQNISATVIMVTHSSKYLYFPQSKTANLICISVKYLPLAHQVIVIPSSPGQEIQHGEYREIQESKFLIGLADKESHEKPSDDTKAEQVLKSASELEESLEVQDLKRKTGDMAVYNYYFRSVGLFPMVVFMFFVLLEVFAESFSSK